jgi:hypothetical protein
MAKSYNTITGSIKVVSSLEAKYDFDPSEVVTKLGAIFQKSFAGVGKTLKNMRLLHGAYTPANNSQIIADFAADETPSVVVLFTDKPVAITIYYYSDILGGFTPVSPLLVDGLFAYRLKRFKDFRLYSLSLTAPTNSFDSPTDIEQGVPINWTLMTFEEA